MSPAADDPPSFADGAASPAATGGPSSEAEPLAAGNPTAAGEAAPASGTPANRHRRRRRRHRQAPPRDGAATGAAGAEAGGETVAGGAAAARAAEAGLAATPNPARPPRRRRRRRPPFMAAGASRAGLGSALPPVAPDEGGGTDPAAAEAPEISADADPSRPRRPTLHLRRPVRGRRQLPHPPGLQVGLAGATPAAENEAQSAEEAVAGRDPATATPPPRVRLNSLPAPVGPVARLQPVTRAEPERRAPARSVRDSPADDRCARDPALRAAMSPRGLTALIAMRGGATGASLVANPAGAGTRGGAATRRRGASSRSFMRWRPRSTAALRTCPTTARKAAAGGSIGRSSSARWPTRKAARQCRPSMCCSATVRKPSFPISVLPAPPPTRRSSTRKS